MRKVIWLVVIFVAVPVAAHAQGATTNPVTVTAQQLVARY